MRHRDVEAQPPGQLTQLLRQTGGVEAAGVDDDLDLALHRLTEARLHLSEEGVGVAARRVLHALAAEDEHGQLGEVSPRSEHRARPR